MKLEVLVTGGGGFLGLPIVQRLKERGHHVRSFSRSRHPELAALGVEQISGDIASPSAVDKAVKGAQAVVHTAAKAGVWGDPEDYRRTNVAGTHNIVAACHKHRVERLVYTSTPSVVHSGGDIEGGDESLPYADTPKNDYQATKITAEREVLGAESKHLAVAALRPHLIWGPRDPHLVPRLFQRVRRGKIALPGGGRKRVDTVYVDNAADAHVAALERLFPEARCSGKAYFITNGDPRPLREIILGILAAGDVHAEVIDVPPVIAKAAGALLERGFRAARSSREPPLTRFVAEQLSTAHWFDISAARRELKWEPEVSIDEGLRRLATHLA